MYAKSANLFVLIAFSIACLMLLSVLPTVLADIVVERPFLSGVAIGGVLAVAYHKLFD